MEIHGPAIHVARRPQNNFRETVLFRSEMCGRDGSSAYTFVRQMRSAEFLAGSRTRAGTGWAEGEHMDRGTERRAYRAHRRELWARVRAVGYMRPSADGPLIPPSLTRYVSPHDLPTVARLLDYPSAQALADELWAYRLPDLPPAPPVPAVRKRISAAQRRALWERDRGQCGLCGQPVAYEDAVVDHILPVAHGGRPTSENLQVAHPSCNAYKASSPNPRAWQERAAALQRHGRPVVWFVVEERTRQRGRVSWHVEPSSEYEALRRRHWWAVARVLAQFSTRQRALRMVWKLWGAPELCGDCQRAWADHQEDGSCPG